MSTMTEDKKGLTTQSIDTLMKAAFALTHKIHAVDKIRTTKERGSEERLKIAQEVTDLRAQRDLIVREIKRRAGER